MKRTIKDFWSVESTVTVDANQSTVESTISQERLDNLAMLYIERDISSKLWQSLNHLVIKFAQLHKNSKIELI